MSYPDPPEVIQITEVIREAEQGMTKPILCAGDDGRRYYVKGQQTDRASLWREWIAGHLAEALALPEDAMRALARCVEHDFWRAE